MVSIIRCEIINIYFSAL